MKNIHILPSPNPSRLLRNGKELLLVDIPKNYTFFRTTVNVNIYITSDELPKLDEWGINNRNGVVFKGKGFTPDTEDKKYDRKIILTTDEYLVRNGVQAIPDDVIKWFVNNPTCGNVEIVQEYRDGYGNWYSYQKGMFVNLEVNLRYKIIIPKEEPKQIKCYDKYNQVLSEGDYVDVQKDGVQLIYKKEDNQLYFKPYGEEDRVSAYFSNDLAKCDEVGNWINNDRYEDIVEEPKQKTIAEIAEKLKGKELFKKSNDRARKVLSEIKSLPILDETLEEAKRNYLNKCVKELRYTGYCDEDFEAGAKWHAERSYSLEEIAKDFLGNDGNDGYSLRYLNFKFQIGRNTEWEQKYIDSGKNPEDITFLEWFKQFKKE